MKTNPIRAAVLAAVLIALTSPALACAPANVTEYGYGPLDEPRADMTYELSADDDPDLIPTDGFDLGGLRYDFLSMTEEPGTAGTATYTVTYRGRPVPKTRPVPKDETVTGLCLLLGFSAAIMLTGLLADPEADPESTKEKR